MNQAPPLPPPSGQALPHDIRGLIPYVTPWWVYLIYVGAALLLAGLAFAAWRYWKHREKKVVVIPPRDPWDVLAERAGFLLPKPPFEGKAQEDYYFELSMLLREAIELRTKIRATDLTFQELREPVRKKLPLPTNDVESVLQFCEHADQVKFAAKPSGIGEAESARQQVESWVRALRPRAIDQQDPRAAGAGALNPFASAEATHEAR